MTEKSEPCGTCRKNFFYCPGHFGYIDLPLPVVNPIFHRIIGIILRMSCLKCFRFQIPEHIKYSLSLQIKLLKCGLITEAQEIENQISEQISAHESLENIPEDALTPIRKYEQLAKETLEKLDEKYILSKNTEKLKNQFINSMLKEIKTRQSCMHCKCALDKIQVLRNRVILSNRKKTQSDKIVSEVRAFESKYITPDESRTYLNKIYEQEMDLMKEIIAVLAGIDSENPTDVFYWDIIPVIPPNMRPVSPLLYTK